GQQQVSSASDPTIARLRQRAASYLYFAQIPLGSMYIEGNYFLGAPTEQSVRLFGNDGNGCTADVQIRYLDGRVEIISSSPIVFADGRVASGSFLVGRVFNL